MPENWTICDFSALHHKESGDLFVQGIQQGTTGRAGLPYSALQRGAGLSRPHAWLETTPWLRILGRRRTAALNDHN
jgi:hypothetical protein